MRQLLYLLLLGSQIGEIFLQDLGDLGDDSLEGGGDEEMMEEKSLGNCTKLVVPPTATASSNSTAVGAVVQIKCRPGYYKVGGDDTRGCQPTLTWSGKDIVCQAKECPALELKRATANTTLTTFGTVVKLTCIKGTTKQAGSAVRMCQANQRWSGYKIFCQYPMCKEVKVANARVDTTKRVIGTVRKYQCNEGFLKIKGDLIRKCGKDKKWTGEAPDCRIPLCKKSPNIKHAKKSTERRKVGTVVKYKCNRGYGVKPGSHGTSSVLCRQSLTWSPIKMKCVKKSRRKKKKKKGSKKRKGGKGKTGVDRSCKEPKKTPNTWQKLYKRRGALRMGCLPGRWRVGRGYQRITRKCRKGKWTGRPLKCELRCDYRENKHNIQAKFSKKRTIPGTTVKYTCFKGYLYRGGDKNRTCLKTGYWSGKRIICREDENFALDKPAFQSSSYANYSNSSLGAAIYALDHGKNVVRLGGCSRTSGKDAPWWAVDLQDEYPVESVAIREFNKRPKGDMGIQRSTITITNRMPGKGSYKPSKNETCVGKVGRFRPYRYKRLKCQSTIVGRYVVIHKSKISSLILCEVKVFVEEGLARFRPAFQSSTFMNYSASLAVDGSRRTAPNDCSVTANQLNPWWAVDLGKSKAVATVYLFYKKISCPMDRLANFDVSVTNAKPSGKSYMPAPKDVCYSQKEPMKSAEVKRIVCKPGLSGRYLVVSMKGKGSLSLCEVMAYGKIPGKQVKSKKNIKAKLGNILSKKNIKAMLGKMKLKKKSKAKPKKKHV